MSKKFYINVQGGTGLNLGLASFISYIKTEGDDNGNKDYEFYVASPYFDIFEACPHVDGVYKPQELRDLIFDANTYGGELILHRLYDMDGFVKKELNYSQAWAKLMNIPFTDTDKGTKVKSYLTPFVKYGALKNFVEQVQKDLNGKKFVIMQFWGGQSPLVQVPNGDWSKVNYDYVNEPLKRHYPVEKATEFVKLYKEAHPDTEIILYSLPNEPNIDGTKKYVFPYLTYYELAKLPECKGIVAIDSSLQHLTAGLKPSVIIWGHSKPEHFGYSYNRNIEQPCRTNDLLYFSALGPSGAKVQYIEPEELLKEVEEEIN